MPWEALAFWTAVSVGPFIIAAIFIRIINEKEQK